VSSDVPQQVLSQALGDVIAGRRVRVAMFTTYSFDPGFFELQVLPILFELPFRQADVLKRIQLEDALRQVEHIAVYYDQRALASDAEPAQLDYRRIDVRHATGAFHPKLVLLLVEEPGEDGEPASGYRSLIVGILSANLTRSGWWENVECAHFEEIRDRDLEPARVPFRGELMALLRRVRRTAGDDEDHGALDAIRDFLRARTVRQQMRNVRAQGAWYTSIYHGQARFDEWLRERRLDVRDWNVEVISPFFPPAGARPLDALIEAVRPREVRVFLPTDADGKALVSPDTYAAVAALEARWASLPTGLLERGSGPNAARLPERGVHAKVYRFWRKGEGEVLVVGSVNLTDAAHGRGGNLEAAWLIDVSASSSARWWLAPLETEPAEFVDVVPAEDEGLGAEGLDLSLDFDWGSGSARYRLRHERDVRCEVSALSGARLFEFAALGDGTWRTCGDDAARVMEEHLRASSFVEVRAEDRTWTVLVREENVAHRPSILERLTPEEILEFWALLTPEQRAAFLERKLPELRLEGLGLVRAERLTGAATLFDRFAGIYHAFGCLRCAIDEALAGERPREAEAKLLGAKYDSLPSLLQRELDDPDRDAVVRYVTFLCARQVRDGVLARHPEFVAACAERTARLDGLLARLGEVRAAVALDDGAFLDWFEPAFLAPARVPDEAGA
jgi:hypothetical protein